MSNSEQHETLVDMCGRFTLRLTPSVLQHVFDLFREPETVPRYNIAPTQSVPVIRRTDDGNDLSMMRWGLIPSWAKDVKIGASIINARSETAATKPAFRSAFKRRRCLIPADGFYEWKKTGEKTKQPYLIGLKDGEPFAFAGLWEIWKSPEGNSLESCTILTTEANSLLRELHDRMPVILDQKDYEAWLDPEIPSEGLAPLLSLAVPVKAFCLPGTWRRNSQSSLPQFPRPPGWLHAPDSHVASPPCCRSRASSRRYH